MMETYFLISNSVVDIGAVPEEALKNKTSDITPPTSEQVKQMSPVTSGGKPNGKTSFSSVDNEDQKPQSKTCSIC